ncbi:BPI fold-containing family B member 2 isoform X2 [Hemicordylus capensis]|nr:BPI fold-containing family B member 2 isoform X2 [Hemicordylus capensis]XP_053104238.1 BPI fold-containing family B member 2 isoform X2 [Hemicordylus capensis]
MLKLCSLGLLLCFLVPSHGTTPGTVVRIHQEALEFASQQGKPYLLRGLLGIQLPGLKGNAGLFGSLMNLVGIKIMDAELPHLSVNLVEDIGIQVSLGSNLHIRANLLVAPLELKVGTSILLDVRIMRSPRGCPILSITACKSLLGDVQILVGGNNLLGWLSPIKKHLHAVLLDKMCLSISNVFLGLNAKLGTLVGVNPINSMSNLQYSMLDPPVITSEYIDMPLSNDFKMMGKHIEDASTGPSFSLPPQATVSDNSMVNMGLSEDFFNNYFATLGQSGALNLNIGVQSGSGGYRLTRSMFETAIPSIAKRYPQDVFVGLNVVLSRSPILHFQEGEAVVTLSPAIQLLVGASGASSQTQVLATFGVDLSLSLKMVVTVTSLQVSVGLQGAIGLEVESSSIEITQVSDLRRVVASVLEEAFLPHLNANLGVGFSLPKMSNVQYVSPEIEIHEDYAQVNCDLAYSG